MKNNNESGLLSLFSSIVKKTIDVPEEIQKIAEDIRGYAAETLVLAQTVSKLTKIVTQHHQAIEELITIQAYIVANMKMTGSMDAPFPDLHKEKSEKPN